MRRSHAQLPISRKYPPLPRVEPVSDGEVAEVQRLLSAAYPPSSASATPAPAVAGFVAIPADAFVATAPVYAPPFPGAELQSPGRPAPQPFLEGNPQTDALLAALGLPHVHTIPSTGDAVAHRAARDARAREDPRSRPQPTASRWSAAPEAQGGGAGSSALRLVPSSVLRAGEGASASAAISSADSAEITLDDAGGAPPVRDPSEIDL